VISVCVFVSLVPGKNSKLAGTPAPGGRRFQQTLALIDFLFGNRAVKSHAAKQVLKSRFTVN
jgi:hypothetical protein